VKYHWLSIIGLTLASVSGLLLSWLLVTELLFSAVGAPIIFIALLMVMLIAIIVGWAKPESGVLLLLFAGVMISTYSATTAGRYSLFQGLLLGVPLAVSAILLAIGCKIKRPQRVKSEKNEQRNSSDC